MASLKNRSQQKLLDAINERVQEFRDYVPTVAIFGDSGAGKSSLCNAIFGKDVAEISDVEACTREPQDFLLNNADYGGIRLLDVPGVGEDPGRQVEYIKLYKKLLPKIDLVLWVLKSDSRNYHSAIEAYSAVFGGRKNAPPVIFVLTQVDKISPAAEFDYKKFEPSGSQYENILKKQDDVWRLFKGVGSVISVAIEERKYRKNYNLIGLVDLIVEVLPNEKKYSITREANDVVVSSEARFGAEKGIWDAVKEMAGDAWDVVKERASEIIIGTIAAKVQKIVAPFVVAAAKSVFKIFGL
ncbi:GTPase family protein [Curvibacter gracilis]|uniref:GTPase family protein n=1 Tax=Curvibacter gracilis TaxID=230310 RepID=UPI00146FB946|nr:GTPase [Curvibacter gracilis]